MPIEWRLDTIPGIDTTATSKTHPKILDSWVKGPHNLSNPLSFYFYLNMRHIKTPTNA